MPRGRVDWSGPRLPRAPRSPEKDEFADPAKGERVERCRVCGMPETPGNKVIPGLWGYLRFNMSLNLCERCVRDNMPRELADPLTLEEVA